ncbi:DNRLRE domain-containing protein [Herbidospora cretacea]|uniref:DNRLRE domain-containing protein n=1 Tax=Herbidospora cretacea TaxID=28444 RepID=UPI000773A312|nr:DNRLRE domain-containing protein [Herbidospora cretacea]
MRALSLLVTLLTAAAPAAVPSPAAADPPSLVVVRNLGPADDVGVSTAHDANSPARPDQSSLSAGSRPGSVSRGYLRFDLSSLPEGVIRSATLRLTATGSPACGPVVGEGIQVRRVTDAWSAGFLHWGNTPGSTSDDAQVATKGVTKFCAVYPDTVEWPVTDIVQEWESGTDNHGLVLQSPDETTDDGLWQFRTRESSTVPILSITMDAYSAPHTSGAYMPESHQEGDDIWVRGPAPRVAAYLTDPAGGALAAEFEVGHDPAVPAQGSGLIWTATTPPSTNPKPSLRIPEGLVQDDWRIRWRARAHNTTAGTVSAWSPWKSGTVSSALPEIGAPELTPSSTSGGVTVVPSLTPEVRTVVTHPFIQSTYVVFEIEHHPDAPEQGAGYIWSGLDEDYPATGEEVRIAVPEGVLRDGWRLRWRIQANGGPFASQTAWQEFTVDVE